MQLSQKKILVVFDTNVVYAKKTKSETTTFLPDSSFINLLDWIETNSVSDICLFAVPDMVVAEIAKQHFDYNISQFKSYNESAKFFNITIENAKYLEPNFDNIYNNVNEFFKKKNITIIPYPYNLKSIIDRAIHKRKPFDGGDKKSDSGFKDVVILHSILEINNLKDFEKIFLLTKNKNDFPTDLEKEICNLNIFNTGDIIETFKKNITDNYMWKNKLVKFIKTNEDYILEYLFENTGEYFSNFYYDENNFILNSTNNIIEFSISIITKYEKNIDSTLFFDLNANTLTEDPNTKNNEEEYDY